MGLQEMWRIICLGGIGLTTTISTQYGQIVDLGSGAAGVGLGELTTPTTSSAYGLGAVGHLTNFCSRFIE